MKYYNAYIVIREDSCLCNNTVNYPMHAIEYGEAVTCEAQLDSVL